MHTSQLSNQNKHRWLISELGNWYTEYQCKNCKLIWVEQPEDITGPPKTECHGHVKTVDK